MFNPDLYLIAYQRIYPNNGALTPGVTSETADGMTLATILKIIEAMRYERYYFAPTRRVMIPKKSGGTRPLGVPTWSDKLVAEVMRLLLEAYYEPQFSDFSHGFRPGRGCHTALRQIEHCWTGVTWFIEADIHDCFGSLDHQILLDILAENIHDGRFIELVRRMLKAGYLEDWQYHKTLSGTAQGSGCSPILANIYLGRLDQFVTTQLIPKHTAGITRQPNPQYLRVQAALTKAARRKDLKEVKRLKAVRRTIPSKNLDDPGFRRLRYCRYADDEILGFIGPKAEAEQIKQELANFCSQVLKLTLSDQKTLITHARTSKARFLGYNIWTSNDQTRIINGRRTLPGKIRLGIPPEVIKAKTAPYKTKSKPARLTRLINENDYTIVGQYGAIYRGIVGYYKLATNIHLLAKLRWVMELSMLKTLAGKHHSTVTKMSRLHKVIISTSRGLRTCFQAILGRGTREPLTATFGEIQLHRDKTAYLKDAPLEEPTYKYREIIKRLAAKRCEVCGTGSKPVTVHQIRSLAELNDPNLNQPWHNFMRKRHRITIIVCDQCHQLIHQ